MEIPLWINDYCYGYCEQFCDWWIWPKGLSMIGCLTCPITASCPITLSDYNSKNVLRISNKRTAFFFIRSIVNYFVYLVTIVVTMFIFSLLVCNRSVIIRVINKIGRPRSGTPICLSRVWLNTELDDTNSYYQLVIKMKISVKRRIAKL